MVPQGLWLPRSETDRQRHVRDAPLQYPIWLHRSNGSLGVSMLHAASGNLSGLYGSQETINIGGRSTIHLRIMVSHSLLRTYGTHRKFYHLKWPGYIPQNHQMQLRDQTRSHNYITTERFVASVGRALSRFFDVRRCPCHLSSDAGLTYRTILDLHANYPRIISALEDRLTRRDREERSHDRWTFPRLIRFFPTLLAA